MGRIMLEKNGKTLDFFPGEVSTDRIAAIQVFFIWLITLLTINCIGIMTFVWFRFIMCRKLTGVWHLYSLKLMGLTILILKRFKFPCIHAPDLRDH